MNHTAALVLATLLLASRTLGAEPCPPRAALDGDPAVVARVRDELVRLGVEVAAALRGCPVVRARVEIDRSGGVAVVVAAVGDGRSEGRVVSDASLAATWIDSWLRDDLDSRWRMPVAAVAAGAAPVAHPPVAVVPRSVLERGALAIGYEKVFSGDAAASRGGSIAACAALHGLCIGARVRYQHQVVGATAWPSDERTELAALATASTAFELGRMAIVPELGLGAGRLQAKRSASCVLRSDECDASGATCVTTCVDPAFQKGDGEVMSRSVSSYQPRAAAALHVAVPLFDHVWLEGIASVTYVPFAHAGPFMLDPGGGPAVEDASFYALAGEPSTVTQLGIGLRVGVP